MGLQFALQNQCCFNKALVMNGLVANAELSCNKNFSCVYKGANNIYLLPMFEWKFKMTTKDIYLILKVPIYANIVYLLLCIVVTFCDNFCYIVKKKVGKCRFLVLKKTQS
jgi:CDP-diglyceride synthetase